jgi:hypothetical protein
VAAIQYPDDLATLLEWQQTIVGALEQRRVSQQGPQNFTTFVRAALNVRLSRAQFAFCRVAFDGEDPVTDTKYADYTRRIFGEVDRFEKKTRSTVVAVCGARAGKTYIFGALRMLHLALTVDLSTLAPGEPGYCYLVAPSIALANQAMYYVRGALNSTPALSSLIVGKPSKEVVRLRRPDGHLVEITVRAASRGGASVRGGSTCGAFLDECAFFRSDDYEVTDDEIYRAIEPRILPGGQIVIASTPWTKSGLLYRFFEQNFGHPDYAVAAHAPTLLMLNTERNRQVIDRVRKDDPENASREFDANFVSSDAESFFDEHWVDTSVDPELTLPRKPAPGDEVKFGCDLGFASDCSALVGVHGEPGGIHTVAELLELHPTKSERLKPSEVIQRFSERIRWHSATYVMADKHYRESIWEMLNDHNLTLIDAPNLPSDAYVVARTKLHEGKCRLPNHPRLLKQLKEVRVRRGEAGRIHIIKPRFRVGEARVGGHGDIVDAWVLAVYQSAGEEVPADAPVPGTPAYSKMLSEEIRERRRREVMRNVKNAGRRPASQWARKYIH